MAKKQQTIGFHSTGAEPVTILTGDCVEGMKTIVPGEVKLAFADPPFNIGFEYDSYHDKRSPAEYVAWCRKWISQIYEILHPAGSFWLAIGDEFVSELDVLSKDIGFCKRSHVIWYYTFGVNCSHNFSRSHTHLLYYTRASKGFTFNGDQSRVPSARQTTYNDARQNSAGRLPDNTWIMRPQESPILFQEPQDTWHCPRICGTFKARNPVVKTQMPEQVLGRIIRLCSDEGDLVLDPFCGSGTTPAVAKKLGRRSVGFEISKSYGAYARKRTDGVKAGDPLDPPNI